MPYNYIAQYNQKQSDCITISWCNIFLYNRFVSEYNDPQLITKKKIQDMQLKLIHVISTSNPRVQHVRSKQTNTHMIHKYHISQWPWKHT